MKDVQIGFPTADDWDWIVRCHAETAWASLTPELQHIISIQRVRDSLVEQTTKFRAEHGVTNQVFIAQSADRKGLGYIWVGRVKNAFTSAVQAHILNIYVADKYRCQGIGAHLLAQAEAWACGHKLDRIGLSVSAHNKSAIDLYKNHAYQTETIRMFNNIDLTPS